MTITVDQVRQWANTRLAAPDPDQLPECTPAQAFRLGIISLLEKVLLDTGNYRGYFHQDVAVPDETRRVYLGPARPLIETLNEPAKE